MLELCFVLARNQNNFFYELADAVCTELAEQGVRSRVSVGEFPDTVEDRVFVLMPPHEYYRLEGIRTEPTWATLQRTIFICAEQPGSSFFDDDVFLADRAGAVFDISRLSIDEFRRRGVPGVRHFPLGWTPAWSPVDLSDAGPGDDERDIDLLHMGIFSPKRGRDLAVGGRWLWPHKACLLLAGDQGPNTAPQANYVMGAAKWDLMRRSRVLLNLHVAQRPYFEWLRIVQAIGAGCAVVSERSIDYEPLVPGEHLLFGSPDSAMLMALELIDDEAQRLELATSAWRFLKAELPLARSVEALVEAAVEVNRNPLPATRRSTRFRLPTVEAQPEAENEPYPSTVNSADASAVRGALKDIRLDLIGLRRTLVRAQLTQERGGPPPLVEVAAQTTAWTAAAPRVSFVTALYNHADHIRGALGSAALSQRDAIELVITDDGSSDHSGDAVRGWMRDSNDVPALLLRHPVNRGLGAARNTAVDFARGEFVFVLDADNEVLPNTLEKLVAVLDDNLDAVFAYGMLEMFTTQGPAGLRSYYPWLPDRLKAGNFVDAMALIRRRWLIDSGGYAEDTRLHGWEDYDLWCRAAEQGLDGVMIPEIVGRYRSALHSMLSLTDISSRQAVALLADRHPNLFAGVAAPL